MSPLIRNSVSTLVLSGALVLQGCGGGSSDTSTSTATPTPTATATATPTPTPSATSTSTTSDNGVGTGVSQGDDTAAVVTAANAFLDTLSTTQKTVATSSSSTSTALFAYTRANAIVWTNLPGTKHGLLLSSNNLSDAQLTAAENLMATALSTQGKTLADELRRADDVLVAAGAGSTYGSGNYYIAILGTPSTTDPWMLQILGHHMAYNIPFNGTYVSGTPSFLGVEPPNWAVSSSGTISVNGSVTASTSGTQHAPMETQRAAVDALATALQANSTYASGALLSGTYTDVVAGASGNSDGNFGSLAYPTSGRGLLYTSLDSTTQDYVKAVIEAYVNTMPSSKASELLSVYESTSQLASTYVGYSKGSSGTADFGAYPSGTTSSRSYLRVDGPRIWIEFAVQNGVVFGSQIHYHTIWRDKVGDYGGELGNGSSNFNGS